MIYRFPSDPIQYGYGVGRVKVLETRLLNAHRLERLVEAEDFSQAVHILGETEYGRMLEGVSTGDELEKALDEYSVQIYQFLREIGMGENWLSFFLIKHDMHNLKVILKSHFLGEGIEDIFFPPGWLDITLAREAVSSESFAKLPPAYARASRRAKEKYEATKVPQLIDILMDQEMFEELYRLALSEKRKFLKEYVAAWIDVANLKIFLRSKIWGKEVGFLEEALIDHGGIAKKTLLSVFPEPWEGIVTRLRATRYARLFPQGWWETIASGSLNHFDTIADNFLLELAKRGKRIAIGPEPIFGYMLAKESEIKTIRLILVSKLAGLPRRVIKERIRSLYV